MYTSFKNKGDTSVEESWETVSCMVQYKQEELQDELDDEQMQEFATVHSYLGTALFDNATLAGKKFADFNTAELKDDQSWSWEVNTLESLGFT